jgi:hypothetical protein
MKADVFWKTAKKKNTFENTPMGFGRLFVPEHSDWSFVLDAEVLTEDTMRTWVSYILCITLNCSGNYLYRLL